MKAMLYLALHTHETKRITVKDMYESVQVPQAYLAKILQALSRQNIVSSVRGPRGGFYLSKENRGVRLMEIIHVIDGENRLTPCILSIHECNIEHPCPMHHLVSDAKTSFIKSLQETTVEDLLEDINSGKSFLPL